MKKLAVVLVLCFVLLGITTPWSHVEAAWVKGDTTAFWAFDYGFFRAPYQLKAMCRAVGDHCYVFSEEQVFPIPAMAVNPVTGTIFAIADSLRSSVDGGESWSQTGVGPSYTIDTDVYQYLINSIAVHPISSSKGVVLVSTPRDGAFWTENDGGSWKQKNSSLGDLKVTAVTVAPSTESSTYMMYVATQDSGVYARQHQVPKKWGRLSSTGLPDTAITYLAADPTDKDLVYAGTPIGIYKWSATDESWSQILADKDIRMIVADPANGNVLYAATPEGVYKTTDGGSTWVQKNTGLTNTDVNVVAIHPTNTSTIYAGTEGAGVFKSTNGGDSWEAKIQGFDYWGVPPYIYQVPSLATTASDIVIAGTRHGIFRSVDAGQNWAEANTGILATFFTDDAIQDVVDDFETSTPGDPTKGVYQICTDAFGDEPDVDNDPKIVILVMDIVDDPDVEILYSYFLPVNEQPKDEAYNSNETEILYIDGAVDPMKELVETFQRMIHWNYDPDEERWIWEGTGQYGLFLCGIAPASVVFAKNTNITFWGDVGHTTERGMSYLLMMYLYEKYGGAATMKAIVQDTLNAVEGLDNVLSNAGYTESFKDVFSDWTLACYLNISDTDFHGGKYGMENVVASLGPGIVYWTDKPYSLAPLNLFGVEALGCYAPYSDAFDSVLVFNGDYNCPNFHIRVIKMDKGWEDAPSAQNIIEIVDMALDDRNVGHEPLRPAFGTTYPTAVWVMSNEGTEGPITAPYVIADDITPPSLAEIGVFQTPMADEYLNIYVFSNEKLYENVTVETPVVDVVQNDTVRISMAIFTEPGYDSLNTIYSGRYALSTGTSNIKLRAEDIAGNVSRDSLTVVAEYLNASTGGKIASGPVNLDIPADALYRNTFITLSEASFDVSDNKTTNVLAYSGDRELIGVPYSIGPYGLNLNKLAHLTFHYNEAVDPEDLGIYRFENGTWIYVGGQVDPENKTISCDIDRLGTYGVQAGPHTSTPIPETFELHNTPNPFISSTVIAYQLPRRTHISLKIYNISGQLVNNLVDREEGSGYKTIEWEGKDTFGRVLGSGTYFLKMEAGDINFTKKLILIQK